MSYKYFKVLPIAKYKTRNTLPNSNWRKFHPAKRAYTVYARPGRNEIAFEEIRMWNLLHTAILGCISHHKAQNVKAFINRE